MVIAIDSLDTRARKRCLAICIFVCLSHLPSGCDSPTFNSIADQLAANPHKKLTDQEVALLVKGIDTGAIGPKTRRAQLVSALVKRQRKDGGAVLLDRVFRRWSTSGEYQSVIGATEDAVNNNRANSHLLLVGLAAYSPREAQRISDNASSWSNSDEKLFITLFRYASNGGIRIHRREIERRIEDGLQSERFTSHARQRLGNAKDNSGTTEKTNSNSSDEPQQQRDLVGRYEPRPGEARQ